MVSIAAQLDCTCRRLYSAISARSSPGVSSHTDSLPLVPPQARFVPVVMKILVYCYMRNEMHRSVEVYSKNERTEKALDEIAAGEC